MDPDIVHEIRVANEACIALITLMMSDDSRVEATKLAASDPVYGHATTCMAIATLAVTALNTLAQELEIDPLQLVQVAGISAAQYSVYLESLLDEE